MADSMRSVRKPLLEITMRACGQRALIRATISGRSERRNGSPPEMFTLVSVGGS